MDIKLALRASHIYRWGIVDCSKRQSIAEHMYNVWLIATAFYDSLFTSPVNTYDRMGLAAYALTHDLGEIGTGDIPTPAKKGMKGIEDHEHATLHKIDPEFAALPGGFKGTLVECVVKIADICESLLFLQRYAVDRVHAEEVRATLVPVLAERLAQLRSGKFLVHGLDKFNAEFWKLMGASPDSIALQAQWLGSNKTEVPGQHQIVPAPQIPTLTPSHTEPADFNTAEMTVKVNYVTHDQEEAVG